MSMYIRLKRKNQTMFLHVEPSDNFDQIKTRISMNFNMEKSGIMLVASDKKRELVDAATVSDQEIRTDDVVYMVFQREGGGGWEELHADPLVAFAEEAEQSAIGP